MLPRSQRLSVLQFNLVMEKGRITHSPLFILRSLNAPDGCTHISAVAPQKIFKKATQRNKLRRRIYEAVQVVFSEISQPVHAIIFAKGGVPDADISVIENEVKDIFVKIRLLK